MNCSVQMNLLVETVSNIHLLLKIFEGGPCSFRWICSCSHHKIFDYMQLPCTRFHETTWPQAAKICRIIASGARSVMFPTKTVTGGPDGSCCLLLYELGRKPAVACGGWWGWCGL